MRIEPPGEITETKLIRREKEDVNDEWNRV